MRSQKEQPYTTAALVDELLKQTHSGQTPTTYQMLHNALNGNPSDRRHRHLDAELSRVQKLCAACGLPCLPVLASKELGKRPGQGFFTAYKESFGISALTESGKDRIVVLERVAVMLAPSSCWSELRQAAEASETDHASRTKEQEPPC